MNDREVPSVPVTTLAGLASISDCKQILFDFKDNNKNGRKLYL